MARYTHINDQDIRIIANRYQINVMGYTPIVAGEANSSFLLDSDDERYILTICDGKSLSEVDQLSKVLIHLANHGYLTSRVCLSTYGTPIIKLYGKPVMLKTGCLAPHSGTKSRTTIDQSGKPSPSCIIYQSRMVCLMTIHTVWRICPTQLGRGLTANMSIGWLIKSTT